MSDCVAARYGPQQEPVPATRREDVVNYYYIEFDGATSYIVCGSDASIDSLPTASFTIDAWVRENALTGVAAVIAQHEPDTFRGFDIGVQNNRLWAVILGAINAHSWSVETFTLNEWHHFVYYFDVATGFLWEAIDGAWCTYLIQDALVAYSGDPDNHVWIGRAETGGTPMWLSGDIQWLRISSGDRFGVNVDFAPPAMCAPPAVDGTTVELWAMDEGAGAVTAASVVPASNGAMTNCTWGLCV